jgi:hypothetical protein
VSYPTKIYRYSFFLLLSGLWACSPQEQAFDLCSCLPEQAEQMQLSQECIDACIEKFGENLEGMEAWFAENCPEASGTKPQMAHSSQSTQSILTTKAF